MDFINVGFGGFVAKSRILAVISPESAPIKRIVQTAKADNVLIDATFGRKTKSVIMLDSGHVVISSLLPSVLQENTSGKKEK